MPFTKDTAQLAGKRSSRKGSPNVANRELVEKVNVFLNKATDDLDSIWAELSARDKIKVITELTKLVYPKQLDITTDGESLNQRLEVVFTEMDANTNSK